MEVVEEGLEVTESVDRVERLGQTVSGKVEFNSLSGIVDFTVVKHAESATHNTVHGISTVLIETSGHTIDKTVELLLKETLWFVVAINFISFFVNLLKSLRETLFIKGMVSTELVSSLICVDSGSVGFGDDLLVAGIETFHVYSLLQ